LWVWPVDYHVPPALTPDIIFLHIPLLIHWYLLPPLTDPQLKLYQNGVEIDQYTGDRSYDHLSTYIQDKSTVFARSFAQGILDVEDEEDKDEDRGLEGKGGTVGVPNKSGISLVADEEQLDKLITQGPVFVKFYAPWCGQWVSPNNPEEHRARS
jgi:hypothetical protein